MPVLPSGIVTFLFTDIEGSTRLWERDPVIMREAVVRHDLLLANAVANHEGTLFKHVGDAIQAAFVNPVSAVAAVVDAQRALAAEPWPGTGPLRVRMALHSGEAEPNEIGDYHQIPCLNRLARLLAIGHGGQVLLSANIKDRILDSLPLGVGLLDLGRHRLRDLLAPEHVTQLTITPLPDRFPPLKSLEGFPTNLPQQPTSLVGRESILSSLGTTLVDWPGRLVTLIGPGGVGKTRLALQAAADALGHFPDGVWLIELGLIHDLALLLPAVAQTLGVREGGGWDLREALVAHLAEKHVLLVLDNLEQLPDSVHLISDLLARCPRLRILATSRMPLRLAAEQIVEVEPLGVPSSVESLDHLLSNPSIQLFAERATSHAVRFSLGAKNAGTAAAICRRLDGLPLAIELAAAQVRFLEPEEILADLDNRFAVLNLGDPSRLPHQQALETTIAWSHDRLNEEDRLLFQRLAIFAGGWTSAAARGVLAESWNGRTTEIGLRSLVDASLVRRNSTAEAETRWSMLESIHAFALDRLNGSEEAEEVGHRHATWYLAMAEDAAPKLEGREQEQWLQRLALEHDNFRAASIRYRQIGDAIGGLRLATALWVFWRVQSHLTEGRQWLDGAIAAVGGTHELHIPSLLGAGALALDQGDYQSARSRFSQGLELARESGNRSYEAELLNGLGGVSLSVGDLTEAEGLLTDALKLSEQINDHRRAAHARANLGAIAHYKGDTFQAMERYAACLSVYRDLGDRQGEADMLLNLLLLLAPLPDQGQRARRFGEESLRVCRALGDRTGEGLTIAGLGLVAESAGELEHASALHRQSLGLFTEIDDRANIARALENLGRVAHERGERDEAMMLIRDALTRFAEMAEQDAIAIALEGIAAVLAPDNPERAARLLGSAGRLREETGTTVPPEGRRRYETAVITLQSHLGSEWDALIAAGRMLDVVEAVAEALDERPTFVPPKPGSTDDEDALFAGLDRLLF